MKCLAAENLNRASFSENAVSVNIGDTAALADTVTLVFAPEILSFSLFKWH